MAIALIKNGGIIQIWRDVKTKVALKKKYGLSGSKYREVGGDVTSGQIEDELGGFTNSDPIPKSPTDYTHTRRQFRDLLTATQETEIEAVIKAVTKPEIKRALRNWWNNETLYEWDDREMVKMLKLVSTQTAADIEAAWIIL